MAEEPSGIAPGDKVRRTPELSTENLVPNQVSGRRTETWADEKASMGTATIITAARPPHRRWNSLGYVAPFGARGWSA
jgi:hypothetical protein